MLINFITTHQRALIIFHTSIILTLLRSCKGWAAPSISDSEPSSCKLIVGDISATANLKTIQDRTEKLNQHYTTSTSDSKAAAATSTDAFDICCFGLRLPFNCRRRQISHSIHHFVLKYFCCPCAMLLCRTLAET